MLADRSSGKQVRSSTDRVFLNHLRAVRCFAAYGTTEIAVTLAAGMQDDAPSVVLCALWAGAA